jgi:MarR family transcriptional regulator, 2-MHQ and catechol-resistance regulon repressor
MLLVTQGTVDDDELISTFGRLLEATTTLEQRLGRSLEAECGIALTWFEVLLRLSRVDGAQLSMGALAEQVALTTGGITRLVDRMIAAGLVERRPCPDDRRVSFAALTTSGRDALGQAAAVHARDLREHFAGFSAAERRTLDRLLDRLRQSPLATRRNRPSTAP